MLSAAIQNLLSGDLNSIGLVVGFIGVVLVFLFGLPPLGILNNGAYVGIEVTPKIRLSLALSRLGLVLIAVGFACQFLAVRPA